VNAQGLLSVGNTVSAARYAGVAKPGIVPALLLLTYAGSVAAPYSAKAPRGRAAVMGPLFAATVYSTVSTERLCLIISAALTAAAFIARGIATTGRPSLLNARVAVVSLALAGLLGAVFTGIAFVRVGRLDATMRPVVENKLVVYAFGYLPAFGSWVQSDDARPLGLGTATVAGVDLLTGQNRAATRAYHEFTEVGNKGQATNIYTVFRGLILDFGYPGTFAFLAAAGFASGRIYRVVLLRPTMPKATALAAVYAWIFTSMTQSLFSFTNVSLAIILAGGLLSVRAKSSQLPKPKSASMSELSSVETGDRLLGQGTVAPQDEGPSLHDERLDGVLS